MPKTAVLFYIEDDGTVPIVQWLDDLPERAQMKCLVRLRRLEEMGHELRRPEADYLRDGIHELRIGLRGMNYRILYFFYKQVAIVVSHGITKERQVPEREIERAIDRMKSFEADPGGHTFRPGEE